MLFHKAHIPYIGITGIVSPAESEVITQISLGNSARQIMMGVLVSSKSLRGERNKWPERYPNIRDIAGVFTHDPATFNVIHYNTDQPATLSDQLEEVRRLAGPNLHGFQLNMAWPSVPELRRFTYQNPDQKMILQINQEAFWAVEGLTGGLIYKLKQEYLGFIDHILLDLSAGYGRPLETAWARQQLQKLQDAELGIGLGVAGGLGPASLQLVEPLAKDFPELSIDAEANLRDPNDNLDLDLAQDYLRQAFVMFGD